VSPINDTVGDPSLDLRAGQRVYCPAMSEENLELDHVLLAVADLQAAARERPGTPALASVTLAGPADEIVIDAENQ
jgi:hypothetical protein